MMSFDQPESSNIITLDSLRKGVVGVRDKTFDHDMIHLDKSDHVTDIGYGYYGRVYKHNTTKKRYYSVTTMLGATMPPEKKKILDDWRAAVGEEQAEITTRRACKRGNAVHDTSEQYLLNNPDYYKKVGRYRKQFDKFKSLLNGVSLVNALEIPLYSDVMGVAGRVDCIGYYKGIPSVVDFKTSTKAKSLGMVESYFLQTCMYSLMLEERTGIKREQLVILMAVQKSVQPLLFIDQRKNWLKPLAERIKQFKSMLTPLTMP